jgi:hypothetical protein
VDGLDVGQQRFVADALVDTRLGWLATANGGRPVLPNGSWGSISVTSSVHGTTRFISSRHSRSRVLLETNLNQLPAKNFCFIGN